MKSHINKHHEEASKDPDHLEKDIDGTEIADGPIAEINADTNVTEIPDNADVIAS